MHPLIRTIARGLEAESRQAIESRVDNLMRGVRYEFDREHPDAYHARDLGWNLSRIEIVCCLNAFYQVVLGPLTAAARTDSQSGLLTRFPIHYGSTLRLTATTAQETRECHAAFITCIQNLGIDFWCLQASHSEDLLYRLANPRQRDHD